MEPCRAGKRSIRFRDPPSILAAAAIGGKKESEGPLAGYFDYCSTETKFGQETWEKAENKMQELALDAARYKANLRNENIDVLLAGDLLDQCIGSSFPLRGTGLSFLGLYGACSTMAEALLLAAVLVDGGYARIAAAVTSSHFAGAERQYRFPLVYGGQRTPTAQWTVTGAGCMLLGRQEQGPFIETATIGQVVDLGIKDAANMGAAMAPAAYATIRAHLDDLQRTPDDYDVIVTGDLGKLGSELLCELFRRDGVEIAEKHKDCGCLIYDAERQDAHMGGSGCGCSATTLCGYFMKKLQAGKYRNLLFCATGALLSPLSTQQGESIPGICHAVSITSERRQ
ncbi:MAG: stage V sporulation protein AD [Oscillospiraceae bacterium]|nr:stage V sporulation protein AD [Oscillospiraceae bacterium]